jgi:hypothetical protein
MAEQERKAFGKFDNYGPEVRKIMVVNNPKPLLR